MKKNIFTKLGGLFLGLAMGLGVLIGINSNKTATSVKAADSTQTFTFGSSSRDIGELNTPSTKDGISVTLLANNGFNASSVKVLQNTTFLKVEGTDIKKVTFTYTGASGDGISAAGGSYSTKVWTASTPVTTATFKTGSGKQTVLENIVVTYGKSSTESLVSISSVNAVISASSGDSAWTIASPVVTGVLSNSANVVDVSAYVDLSILESVPTIKEDGTTTVTLVATGKVDPKITISAPVIATLSTFNPLKDLYSKSANYSCDVYGIFVGNKDNNNIVIMYGEYGMDIYKSGCGTNSYVAGETILHVSGPLDIFNGLYEIKATSISTSTTESVPTPVVYVTQGGETSLYQSRLTNISGVPTVTKGSITGTAGSADVTLNFKVGTKDVQVFYKKANQTADGMSKMSAAVTNEEIITVTGFTSWYNGFQIQMTDIVEADASYTAEAFAQDLLSETDAVCAGYNGVADNYSALLTVWNTLIDADHYQKVPQDQKNILVTTVANTSGTDVQKAMARYDYLVAKYGLSPFIDGRTVSPARVPGYINNQNDNTATIIIAVVSVLSLATLCTLIVIKRRKSIEK